MSTNKLNKRLDEADKLIKALANFVDHIIYKHDLNSEEGEELKVKVYNYFNKNNAHETLHGAESELDKQITQQQKELQTAVKVIELSFLRALTAAFKG